MIMKKRTIVLFGMLLMVLTAVAGGKIKVACVGNSVTWGMTITDREKNCYPAQLQKMLGDKYEVRNFGHSGTTLLQHGHRPYVDQQEYQDALNFKADLVIIHLGLNDTDPRNWPEYSEEFNADYIRLIDSFRQANPKAKIWICLMTPIFDRHPRFESGTRDWHAQIQKHIQQVATATRVPLIDLNTPLYSRPDLLADAIHPNAEGAKIIAETVYGALTGNYGGLSLSPLYTDGMVIQRNKPIVFRGKANAGETVKVNFNGHMLSAITNNAGKWKVTFPAEKAGGPYKAQISTKKEKLTIKDIYVGEVWLCSGQSNMELPVNAVQSKTQDLNEADSQTRLHLFNMSAIYPTTAVAWSANACDSVNRHQYLHIGPWRNCSRESLGGFSAVAYHFGKKLADSLQVPVGIICNAVGGTTTESWIDRHTLEQRMPAILRDWYHGDFGMKWARERALQNISVSKNPLQRHPYAPAYMFETGMLPLKGYSIKGVVWYQGESNAHNMELHERLFPMLQKSWRNFFHNPELPFYFVQLSSLNRPSWPRFRDSQRRMASRLRNTWMAVTTDVGDSLDVHYTNKKPVGERLGLQALHHSYDYDIESDGPICHSISAKDNGLELQFTHAKSLSAKGGHLIGFEVAGADGIYYPAEAQITSSNTILVRSSSVTRPLYVRYGWQPFTRANLVNEVGLPCSTFQWAVKK
ncbi:sialate O-acetylesterase [Prevotella melaninogenica]|uniref:GDSL-type esterase/lipase family protein n=1 Tax=Prevotella melaninogenica TaxID=28132 RepID=UPI001BA8B610|nr:GDSL-type esterase/lipase family protein [Prevotella melaninogenica]QUB56672.1 sialate O-acetylesterase [Prevotella melaninogenica]QUB57998.1 sialate O-acetylesterase [Prevotella melaninogenica]